MGQAKQRGTYEERRALAMAEVFERIHREARERERRAAEVNEWREEQSRRLLERRRNVDAQRARSMRGLPSVLMVGAGVMAAEVVQRLKLEGVNVEIMGEPE